MEVNPKYSSQECPECDHISSGNREKEKFICEQCGYSDDADTNGAVVCAHRGKLLLGIDSLRVVSPKVTLKDAVEIPRSSSPLGKEPKNPAESTVKQRQLLLLKVKSTPSKSKPRAKPKRRAPDIHNCLCLIALIGMLRFGQLAKTPQNPCPYPAGVGHGSSI
ncbi:transposase [Aetokthonos hydrillicola Thurmond2011]|uniref:Transposase n=1 Tax=Aetokthonos hydrillicola Thurmond2011 TaxID=2712845 RepID=A0AAP5I3J5_9CYAN|nr:transposase [Aetokthonos hydrillicola CCALA 1050]MBW4588177.1 transposase [Aetokthonos hydrillicola CCALA 1050]MDR9893139.1 transposase [Aetokthonos hydrillicola Thurmond2011]